MKHPLPPRLTSIDDADTLDLWLAAALEEDGAWDDVTSLATIPPEATGAATMKAKDEGVFCGAPAAAGVFRLMNTAIEVEVLAKEGAAIAPGDCVMRVSGSLRAILSGERVALNFVQRLSGIATLTRRYVDALKGAEAEILDTRKTTPLWRALDRHAVRCGGGKNHRFALDDMFMIKDNHADITGSVGEAIRRARLARPDLPIAAEARNMREALEAADAGADIVMLDNMTLPQVRRAARALKGRAALEATGGLTEGRIASLARAGIQRLSVGALTHSAPALDLSLDIEPV